MNNSLKNIIKYLILSLIILGTTGTAIFAADDNSLKALSINLINQNPDPVYAGDIVEISLGIENAGYGVISSAVLSIDDEYPFTVISQNDIEITNILSSSSYNNIVKFKLKIDSDAKAGNYVLTVNEYDKSNPSNVLKHDLTLSINSNKNVEISKISKNTLSPGAIENITFTIKNVGTTNLKNVEFSWSASDDILLPVNSDNKIIIDSLKINEEIEVSFLISASSAATADLYKLNLILSYQNEADSTTITQTSNAGIYVGGKTDFDVIFDEESSGEYVFTIANIGANDATSVKVSIDDTSSWKAKAKSSEIIGNLNKGDYTTISFTFSNMQGPLVFNVQYTDTSGNRVSSIEDVSITSEISTNQSSYVGRTNSTTNSVSSQRNPGAQMNNSISTIGTWLKYVGYTLLILFIGTIVYIIYRKKENNISKKK